MIWESNDRTGGTRRKVCYTAPYVYVRAPGRGEKREPRRRDTGSAKPGRPSYVVLYDERAKIKYIFYVYGGR